MLTCIPIYAAKLATHNHNHTTTLCSTIDTTKTNLNSFLHLSEDSILHSLNTNRTVLVYRQPSLDKITSMLDSFSYSVQEQLQLQRVFDGVNGCSITDEQDLWHPGPGIIPEDDNVPDDLVDGLVLEFSEAHVASAKLRRDEQQVNCGRFTCRNHMSRVKRDHRCGYCHKPDHMYIRTCW